MEDINLNKYLYVWFKKIHSSRISHISYFVIKKKKKKKNKKIKNKKL